ncbi:hypothetical protein O1611_g471 [Lasiodiplodia mahajangana]|uniref:Uncharacterized protein n=1 Tax=Lasiodiplodia mahajangana TaxID=1108764 RepID=A0ACC2K0F6_9PEZI|nr:hypothetical protein O1611_g471 [Lasiodiplodia mahajangana]
METGADSRQMPRPEAGRHPGTKESTPKKKPALRRRKTPIFLLILYLPTLIAPWVLLVITARGAGGSYASNSAAVTAARVLNSFNGLLAIPVISALLAYGAVVYAMRRKQSQQLNAQQLFALADRGWSNIPLLWHSGSTGKSSSFLWLAALLVLLGAILQPLMTGLVSFEPIAMRTSQDNIRKIGYIGNRVNQVGFDPEPADMPLLQRDVVLRDVLGRLMTITDFEPEPNMWPLNAMSTILDGNPVYGRSLFSYAPTSTVRDNPGFYVTAVDSGLDTGVFLEHALRLNTSISCEWIEKSAFPSPCPGPNPFVTHVARPQLELSVCAPGNTTQFPFTPSRNRQDITEELFIDLVVSPQINFLSEANNFTLHCTASTSRGYFELPNEQNGHYPGPLLDKWPSPQYIWNKTSDYRGLDAYRERPTEEDSTYSQSEGFLDGAVSHSAGHPFDGPDSEYASTPGPLMVSAEVLFGNYSFVQLLADNATAMTPVQAYAAVCEHGSIPLSQPAGLFVPSYAAPLSRCYDAANNIRGSLSNSSRPTSDTLDTYLTSILASHIGMFNNTAVAEYAFKISTYLANRAILVNTASQERTTGARPIYYSSGSILLRPIVNTPTLVVITILIGLQLLGLVLLTRFIYSVPTWTSTIDALAMTQIGKALPVTNWPPIGKLTPRDEKQLDKIDGLIGVDEGKGEGGDRIGEVIEKNASVNDDVSDPDSVGDMSQVHLALGGKGLITGETVGKLNRL